MIRIERSPEGRVRVIGALTGPVLETLLDVVGTGVVALDLSEVREADAAAVELLVRLPQERCRVVASPKWLELWMNWERRQLPRGRASGRGRG